jgi:small-conductance mechanosensitive channel
MSEPASGRWWPRGHLGPDPNGSAGLPPLPKPNFRRPVITGIIALAALFTGVGLGGVTHSGTVRFVVIGLAVVFVLVGMSAVRAAGRDVFALARPRVGPSAATALRLIATTVGYLLILFGLLELLNVSPASLLVGGVLTGAIIGLAAQQTLGNYFAGLLLLLARPYVPGQRITVHTGAMGGPFTGTVIDAGTIYTVLLTDEGEVRLPNAGVLASGIGPAVEPDDAQPEQADEAAGDTAPPTTPAP